MAYTRKISYFQQSGFISPLFALQKYRHVDNIMFENHTVADRFLDFWRKTGNQHFGYLYGRYTEHKDIPLGIRAEVAAIYEPPQVGELRPHRPRPLCCPALKAVRDSVSHFISLPLLCHLPSLSPCPSLYTRAQAQCLFSEFLEGKLMAAQYFRVHF